MPLLRRIRQDIEVVEDVQNEPVEDDSDDEDSDDEYSEPTTTPKRPAGGTSDIRPNKASTIATYDATPLKYESPYSEEEIDTNHRLRNLRRAKDCIKTALRLSKIEVTTIGSGLTDSLQSSFDLPRHPSRDYKITKLSKQTTYNPPLFITKFKNNRAPHEGQLSVSVPLQWVGTAFNDQSKARARRITMRFLELVTKMPGNIPASANSKIMNAAFLRVVRLKVLPDTLPFAAYPTLFVPKKVEWPDQV